MCLLTHWLHSAKTKACSSYTVARTFDQERRVFCYYQYTWCTNYFKRILLYCYLLNFCLYISQWSNHEHLTALLLVGVHNRNIVGCRVQSVNEPWSDAYLESPCYLCSAWGPLGGWLTGWAELGLVLWPRLSWSHQLPGSDLWHHFWKESIM